jgi:hypothetical protein
MLTSFVEVTAEQEWFILSSESLVIIFLKEIKTNVVMGNICYHPPLEAGFYTVSIGINIVYFCHFSVRSLPPSPTPHRHNVLEIKS